MILVDTSVLVDWTRKGDNSMKKAFEDVVLGFIPYRVSVLTYQELMQGTRSDAERAKIKEFIDEETILHLPTDLDFF